ncbi:tetraspanin-8 isoform X2 [Sceloporus undulatus]|uniref:tetraspanin-8 isoform X2 n=1 Tax=Sceloporus undulatus TaxID=8520 RepID=UPI001C4CAE1E|nr:tetraspanin-8 isoform X2 [Sceloporus undulatus]
MAGVSSCMKYSMFIFNFLFWVCGCIILGVSIWLRVSKSAQADFQIDSTLFSGIDLLIAVGAIIMVLGFLGCCGAMKESQCMLLLFFIGLLAILLLQIVAGILGAVYKSQIEQALDSTMKVNLDALKGSSQSDKDFQTAFHNFEIQYKCCGLENGKSDWGGNSIGCACDKADEATDVCKNNLYTKVLGLVFSMSLYCQIQRK